MVWLCISSIPFVALVTSTFWNTGWMRWVPKLVTLFYVISEICHFVVNPALYIFLTFVISEKKHFMHALTIRLLSVELWKLKDFKFLWKYKIMFLCWMSVTVKRNIRKYSWLINPPVCMQAVGITPFWLICSIPCTWYCNEKW